MQCLLYSVCYLLAVIYGLLQAGYVICDVIINQSYWRKKKRVKTLIKTAHCECLESHRNLAVYESRNSQIIV